MRQNYEKKNAFVISCEDATQCLELFNIYKPTATETTEEVNGVYLNT